MNDEQILKIGEALKPLFAELPEIPLHVWHRFSFDIVQDRGGMSVAHIRFEEIPPVRTNE